MTLLELASFAVDDLHFKCKVSAALISFSEEEVVTPGLLGFLNS
jgi:hypothetical protein